MFFYRSPFSILINIFDLALFSYFSSIISSYSVLPFIHLRVSPSHSSLPPSSFISLLLHTSVFPSFAIPFSYFFFLSLHTLDFPNIILLVSFLQLFLILFSHSLSHAGFPVFDSVLTFSCLALFSFSHHHFTFCILPFIPFSHSWFYSLSFLTLIHFKVIFLHPYLFSGCFVSIIMSTFPFYNYSSFLIHNLNSCTSPRHSFNAIAFPPSPFLTFHQHTLSFYLPPLMHHSLNLFS